MTLDRWWAGWRHEYISAAFADDLEDGEGSLFERILGAEVSDQDAYVVHRGERVSALLNAYPYNSGHVLVMPNRAVEELDALTDEEEVVLWQTVRHAVRAIDTAYSPEGINVGINLGRPAGGSVSEHLHVHVVPRWTGDANFMTAIANTRTLPEALVDTAAKIRAAWQAQ